MTSDLDAITKILEEEVGMHYSLDEDYDECDCGWHTGDDGHKTFNAHLAYHLTQALCTVQPVKRWLEGEHV